MSSVSLCLRIQAILRPLSPKWKDLIRCIVPLAIQIEEKLTDSSDIHPSTDILLAKLKEF